jgi:hypothetical protein
MKQNVRHIPEAGKGNPVTPCVREVVALTHNNSKPCIYARNRFMEYTPSAPPTEVNFLSSLDVKRCFT